MLPGNFRLLRVLHNKPKAFSLTEVLLVIVILSIIIGMALYAMNVARISFNTTLSSKNLQAEVRSALGWIVKDARQAVSWDLANNSPNADYIKFRRVTGWDTVNNVFLLDNEYIEYTFNSVDQTIIRRTSNVSDNTTIGIWTLNNVTASPFFTIDSLGSIVALNSSDLLTSKRLVITISGQSDLADLQAGYSLTEEVQIRNG